MKFGVHDRLTSNRMSVEFVVLGPFRFVKPYYFDFNCKIKRSWIGRSLSDVFTKEFNHWDLETIETRIANGDITVNGAIASSDFVISGRDKINHRVLRREAPVYNRPVVALGETDLFSAFLKPASFPVHATGRYFYNTMMKQIDGTFSIVHRLDKVTSGIIVLAKSKDAATLFSTLLNDNKVHKTYIARVKGVFPEGELRCEAAILENVGNRGVSISTDGKESVTVFKRVRCSDVESVVKCKPLTGRMHQIRAHLAHLGFPITNDELYGGSEPELDNVEQEAMDEAARRGLWPPETKPDVGVTFEIYLCSVRYKSDIFDFRAPSPDWADM